MPSTRTTSCDGGWRATVADDVKIVPAAGVSLAFDTAVLGLLDRERTARLAAEADADRLAAALSACLPHVAHVYYGVRSKMREALAAHEARRG